MKEVLRQLLAYNDEANQRFIQAILAAPPEAERIRAVFSHVLNAHRIWNARLGGVSPTGGRLDLQPTAAWSTLNRENFERSLAVVESEDVGRVIEYRDTQGRPYRNSIRDILIHVVNHSSYHRGQVTLLLGQEGKTPPVTDYIVQVREMGLPVPAGR